MSLENILILAMLALVIVLVGAIFLVDLWMLRVMRKKAAEKTETDTLLDAMDDLRGDVHASTQHTTGEHAAIFKHLHKIAGRLQFLVAKDVADELSALKAKQLDDEAQEKQP